MEILYALVIIVGSKTFVLDEKMTFEGCKQTVADLYRGSFQGGYSHWDGKGFYATGEVSAVCVGPEQKKGLE